LELSNITVLQSDFLGEIRLERRTAAARKHFALSTFKQLGQASFVSNTKKHGATAQKLLAML
jgi:hypothetical protein